MRGLRTKERDRMFAELARLNARIEPKAGMLRDLAKPKKEPGRIHAPGIGSIPLGDAKPERECCRGSVRAVRPEPGAR